MKYVLEDNYNGDTYLFDDMKELEAHILEQDTPKNYLSKCEIFEVGKKVEFTLEMSLSLVPEKKEKKK